MDANAAVLDKALDALQAYLAKASESSAARCFFVPVLLAYSNIFL